MVEELAIMRAHAAAGAQTLRFVHEKYPDNEFIAMGIEIAQSHHERWDGRGYPDGLSGQAIPLCARIVAVADSFDAMTTPRPYQAAMNADYVLDILARLAGARYDPKAVAALTELVTTGALEVKNVRNPVTFRMRKPVPELV